MWINRQIGDKVETLAAQRPAIVISGARQVGKTSLLRKLFAGHSFVTLDLPAQAAGAESEPEEFLLSNPPPLLIDEVQYAPGLFRHLKLDIDRHRSQKGRFILTGSQKFLLMKNVSDSLAGRASILNLETLSYAELKTALGDIEIDSLLLRGGYPELWEDQMIGHIDFYRSYLATYLERDVRSLLAVGSLRDFERFVRACALRSGQLLNKSELARDVGIRPSTAGEWLSVLEASNQVFLLEPWFSNRTKSLVKTPKLYWHDAGFMSYLMGIRDQDDMLRSPYRGAIWETFVFSELRKRVALEEHDYSLFFWRDRGVEVDFLIDHGGTFDLLDAKSSSQPDGRDTGSLLKVAGILGTKRVKSLKLIARPQTKYRLEKGVQIISCNDRWI